MNYGYARVTSAAETVGAQVAQLKKYGVGQVFKEKYTNKRVNRHRLNSLLNQVRQGDTITVTRLSRLTASPSEALNLIKTLREKGVALNVLNLGVIDDTIVGRLTVRILAAVVEMENSGIVERTQAGKNFAKAHNPDYREGRKPALTPEQTRKMLQLIDEAGKSQAEVAKLLGVSQSTISRTYRTEKLKIQAYAEDGDISAASAYDRLGEGGRAIVAQAQADGSWPIEDPIYDQKPAGVDDVADDELPGFSAQIKKSLGDLIKENNTQPK
ncbi:recombinase family protein [Lacticaseibacillus camelliae]|nr:recombinase family protein [Lacticaseibacillus camelliae]